MRTYVSKMLVGPGKDAGTPAIGDVAVAPWGAINALLSEGTTLPAAAVSDEFGFVKRVADLDGNAAYVTAGPFATANAVVNQNVKKTAVKQVSTLTVDLTNSEVGDVFLVKVAYHDNLSIIPNQIKFTIATAVYETGDDATKIATKLRAAFTAQEFIFVDVSGAGANVIFTSKILRTASAYNHIDRPETVIFEVAIPEKGTFSVVATTPPVLAQGTAAQIAWMEEQHMGRRGYSDRRMWNDNRKYPLQVNPTATYDVIVVEANKIVEGDMQDTRSNPVGAVIAAPDSADIVAALATIGVTASVIA